MIAMTPGAVTTVAGPTQCQWTPIGDYIKPVSEAVCAWKMPAGTTYTAVQDPCYKKLGLETKVLCEANPVCYWKEPAAPRVPIVAANTVLDTANRAIFESNFCHGKLDRFDQDGPVCLPVND